jgi:hypothetical protein
MPQQPCSQAIKAPTTSSIPQSYLCVPERGPDPFHRSTRAVMYLPLCLPARGPSGCEQADHDAQLTDQLLRRAGRAASQGRGWGMLARVRSSRHSATLAVRESATEPHACSYRSLDIHVCAPPARVSFRSASMYMSVSADARLQTRARPLADMRLSPRMYLSASTRPLRGRVHPNTAVTPTTCTPSACIPDSVKRTPPACIQPRPLLRKRGFAARSAPERCCAPRRGYTQSVHPPRLLRTQSVHPTKRLPRKRSFGATSLCPGGARSAPHGYAP